MDCRAVVQIPGNGHSNAVSGLQPFSHFETLSTLILGLARGTYLVFGNTISA
jgi:hypothetical protein